MSPPDQEEEDRYNVIQEEGDWYNVILLPKQLLSIIICHIFFSLSLQGISEGPHKNQFNLMN